MSGKLGSLGQKAMVGSAPVVIASDQSAVPVSGSVNADIRVGGSGVSTSNPVPGGLGRHVAGGAEAISAADTASASFDEDAQQPGPDHRHSDGE